MTAPKTTWPSPQDYNEAIQTPASSFLDPQLRRSLPETTSTGLPKPITGNFASVYRLVDGSTSTAVRCFFRDVPDARDRYAAISTHLDRQPVGYAVGFHYLEQGVRVRGRHFPLLKMDWVEGELLDVYIARNLNRPDRLRALAERWRKMALDLRAAGVAHGDLQHGNVLMGRNGIKLVDYDGMFVPALHGRGSHELGHANYQHPGRAASHFGPTLDNFSHWVIYTSLLALSSRPELWRELGAGDEKLLFGRLDFVDPQPSLAFRLLLKSPEPTVRKAAKTLRSALDCSPGDVPALGTKDTIPSRRVIAPWPRLRFPPGLAAQEGRVASTESERATVPLRPLPEWLSGHVGAPSHRGLESPGWRRLPLPLAVLACVLGSLPASGVALGMTGRVSLICSSITVCWLAIVVGYFSDPAGAMRIKLHFSSMCTRISCWRTRRRIASLQRGEARGALRHSVSLETRRLLASRRLQRHERRRHRVLEDVRATIDPLRRHLSRLDEEYETALRHQLQELQNGHVRAHLKRQRLRRAKIRGHSPLIKARLWAQGVRTAADISPGSRRPGRPLDRRTAAALRIWMESCIREAERSMPVRLSDEASGALCSRFERRRRPIRTLMHTALREAAPVLTRLEAERNDQRAVLDGIASEILRAEEVRTRDVRAQISAHESQLRLRMRRSAEIEDQLQTLRQASFPHYLALLLFLGQ
ncbi:MAG TPA: hypothetical protein VFB34_08155 [Chloroflexota bacterium]|nr:hypothetical protein [Chloroflexota bacterium]